MKQKLTSQKGYALFIVMGLMVLATIGVTATYKAVSSYDDKSGASLNTRASKEVVEAGTRAVEAYIADNTWDAIGILEKMYLDKVNPDSTLKVTQLPIANLGGNLNNYDVYLTDVEWAEPNLFVDAQIIGTGRSNATAAIRSVYKVNGLFLKEIEYTIGDPLLETCVPDVALYLGGGQANNITKNLFVKGGVYSTNIQKPNETQLQIEGGLTLGSTNGQLSEIRDQGFDDSVEGSYFFAKPVNFTLGGSSYKQDVLNIKGHAEFAEGFGTSTAKGLVLTDISVDQDLSITDWTPKLTKNQEISVGASVKYYGDFSLGKDWGGAPRLTLKVKDNITFKKDFEKNTTGSPWVTVEVETGYLIVEGDLELNNSEADRDSIFVLNHDSIAILGSLNGQTESSYDNSIRCKSGPCYIIRSESEIPASWGYSFIRASKLLGVDTNTWEKPMDIGVDADSMDVYKKTWKELFDLAKTAGVSGVSGTAPAKFDISIANKMTSNKTFVNNNGFSGFLILNADAESVTPVSDVYNGYGQNELLTGNWAIVNKTKQVDYGPSFSSCFPANTSISRVLWYNTANSFLLDICDLDSDPATLPTLYGFIFDGSTANSNNLFRGDAIINGAVYTTSGNANAFSNSGSVSSADSTAVATNIVNIDMSVLQSVSPLGLTKSNSNGEMTLNCLSGQDEDGNDVDDNSELIPVEKYLYPLGSQLSVKRVGAAAQMQIDVLEQKVTSQNAVSMSTPYVGFSHTDMTIERNTYSDFDHFKDSMDFKPFYQYKGQRTGCDAKWDSIPDFLNSPDTTTALVYTVDCTKLGASRPMSKRFMLTIGDGINVSSADVMSSSSTPDTLIINTVTVYDTTKSDSVLSTSVVSGNVITNIKATYEITETTTVTKQVGSDSPFDEVTTRDFQVTEETSVVEGPADGSGLCSTYESWEVNKDYALGELVEGNALAVYACTSNSKCGEVQATGGSDAIGIWYFVGDCVDDAYAQDTVKWENPVEGQTYQLGSEINFAWKNNTSQNVKISFKMEGDASWVTNDWIDTLTNDKSGNHGWKFETGTGEGAGTMLFKVELENSVGVSDIVKIIVNDPSVSSESLTSSSSDDSSTELDCSPFIGGQCTWDGYKYACTGVNYTIDGISAYQCDTGQEGHCNSADKGPDNDVWVGIWTLQSGRCK